MAQDLDGRADQHRVVEAHVGFLNPYTDALDEGMLLKDGGGYPLGDGLREADGWPGDYLPRLAVDLAVVHGLREVVGGAGWLEVQAQLDIHDEGLPQLAFGGQRPVVAVQYHAFEQYEILTHGVPFFEVRDSMPGRKISRAPSHEGVLTFPREALRVGLMDLPKVTVSYAQTLDGRLATAGGSSRWISCPESLRFAHALRSRHDAIVVGAGTTCKDDPRLTVRHVVGKDPLRVVVDGSLRTPPTAAVLANGAAKGTVFAVTDHVPKHRREKAISLGATVLSLPSDEDGRIHLRALLAELHERGVKSVMVEGGAALITSFLREELVDRLAVCIAPKVLGRGIEAVGDLGVRDLADSLALSETKVIHYGVDIILDGQVNYPNGTG